MKEHDGTIEPIARMNAEWRVEKAEFAEFNLPTCGNIAVWSTAVQRKAAFTEQSCWPDFKLSGCHGVRSHGTSSSQGWRTIIAIQHCKGLSMSYIRIFNQPALCRNAKENLPGETWANIAVCQLCKERQPLWKSHDGLNFTCLDQCHGVRSLGTSSSQGWRKRNVIRHSNVWSLHPCF